MTPEQLLALLKGLQTLQAKDLVVYGETAGVEWRLAVPFVTLSVGTTAVDTAAAFSAGEDEAAPPKPRKGAKA
jgi:hypothetical protein